MGNKVERVIKKYYESRNKVILLEDQIERIQKRINKIRKDLKETNFELYDTLKGIDYSRVIVQEGDGKTSNIEMQLMKIVDRNLSELEKAIKEKYKMKARIIRIEKEADDIEFLLDQLSEKERLLLSSRYGGRRHKIKSFENMETDLAMGKTAIFDAHRRIIDYLDKIM